MSVLMTLRAKGDAAALESHAAADPAGMKAIMDQAVANGLIAHRFYASPEGDIMVVDEWPDPESFQRFFAATEAQIGPMMQAAGVASEPEVKFWRKLEMGDDYGWGAED